jgi:CRP-like cAMP-binding protein
MGALSETEQGALISAGFRTRFSRGDALVREGESGEMLYVLLAGYVKVMVSSINGTNLILAVRTRGDLIGEFAVIDGKPRTASASALDSVIAIGIARMQFLAFCTQNPAANRKIMQSLTEKLRNATAKRTAASSLAPETRVARILHELATEHGRESPEGVVIDIPLTQADLGALTSVATSTVERILRGLRDQNVVRSRYRRSVVIDMAALYTIALTEAREQID